MRADRSEYIAPARAQCARREPQAVSRTPPDSGGLKPGLPSFEDCIGPVGLLALADTPMAVLNGLGALGGASSLNARAAKPM